jgi:hypothetical protein
MAGLVHGDGRLDCGPELLRQESISLVTGDRLLGRPAPFDPLL